MSRPVQFPNIIRVRLSDDQLAKLITEANKRGLSISTAAREIIDTYLTNENGDTTNEPK